ncbi:methylated-DNA--[protein]-cysteine S-methyltransferase [Lentibacillus sediminis]|uniref:methylated-DNA--[protein]-cysteine S-methyltransferase n=1 Tax=Lentibacillus sediminis TaxID=1940529 RepID=UPI001956AD6B|nr:methylated-DNA--[protein]-cysteine S-methyltransferase [Lentibacillus sediminis]
MNKPVERIYLGRLAVENWSLYLAVTEAGLCFVGSEDKEREEVEAWCTAKRPGSELIEDEGKVAPYALMLGEFLTGERRSFELPVDLRGTEFQEAVWEALMRIPYGDTVTYGDIAEKIGRPRAVRAVGAAIGANPVMLVVPCHRVVGKSGKLTGFRGGLTMKEKLLELESS